MDSTNYILPYPYEAYKRFNRSRDRSFNDYKEKIYGWVKENTFPLDNISTRIEIGFSYVEDSDFNNEIKKWLYNHLDKLRYIPDFSGLDFGIIFNQETEQIGMRYPSLIEDEDKELYPNYDENEFRNMSVIDRLEWMYSHCEFIPIRIIYEDISVDGDKSYKFSHIKRNKCIMDFIKDYLENLEFKPKDDIYYFIKFDMKKEKYYLKRDLEMNPRN